MQSYTILVVDQDPDALEKIIESLSVEWSDATFIKEISFINGYLNVVESSPSIVIIGNSAPLQSNLEFVASIRQSPAHRRTNIIQLSENITVEKKLRLECDNVIPLSLNYIKDHLTIGHLENQFSKLNWA